MATVALPDRVQDAQGDASLLWIIARVADDHIALPAAPVLEMIRTPVLHAVPFAPPGVRGIATVRGQVGPMIDMRVRFGRESLPQEQTALVALLRARQRDHRDWVAALEATVRDGTPFAKTLDPRACAFGKWYHGFRAPTPELAWYLQRFERPHALLHEEGAVTLDLLAQGNRTQAETHVARLRASVLEHLEELFDGACRLITNASWEIAVVVEHEGGVAGILVDEVEAVEELPVETLTPVPRGAGAGDPAIRGIAHRRGTDSLVLVADVRELVRSYGTGPAEEP